MGELNTGATVYSNIHIPPATVSQAQPVDVSPPPQTVNVMPTIPSAGAQTDGAQALPEIVQTTHTSS